MTLRVIAPSADDGIRRRADAARGSVDSYLERLNKLVPIEAIGVYPLLHNQAIIVGEWAQILVAWLVLFVVIVLRWHATAMPGRGPQWAAVFIAAVSFVIWVHVMDKGDFGLLTYLQITDSEQVVNARRFLATTALTLWTILVPVFYTGDE